MRLINADTLKAELFELWYETKSDREVREKLLKEINIVNKHPTIDAAPVVRGEWVVKRTQIHDGEPYCSACGVEPYRKSNRELPSYCANCGAKMDDYEAELLEWME